MSQLEACGESNNTRARKAPQGNPQQWPQSQPTQGTWPGGSLESILEPKWYMVQDEIAASTAIVSLRQMLVSQKISKQKIRLQPRISLSIQLTHLLGSSLIPHLTPAKPEPFGRRRTKHMPGWLSVLHEKAKSKHSCRSCDALQSL